MSRLTKKHRFIELYISKENVPQHIAFDKLGKLEDIEDELGCPLDVVFRAIDEGVCASVQILDLETTDTIERPRLYYSDDFKCYCFELLFGEGVVKLKDYKKTWWLKGERENEILEKEVKERI